MKLKSFSVLTVGLTLGLTLVATATSAQQRPNCGQRGAVVERLQSKYGETRRSVGLAANNGVVETFASDESGTWTIVITLPNGVTCLVAAGEAFEALPDKAPAKTGQPT
ncbi:MAG: hypothetical protein AAF761_10500 [Pseudomonadota bacterium]